ncbi:MAG: cupin domain-containing protein [Alphaproteobacteria bacterium]|nr:cupin domain-containing protein [Alphaproteobacteria bacterium]
MPDESTSSNAPINRFSVSKASKSEFKADGLRPFLEYRDLGIKAATGGRWRASLSRSREAMPGGTGIHKHELGVQIVYVLNGSATFEYADYGEFTVIPGDCIYQPSGITHQQTDRTKDCVVLEVVSPGKFPTLETGIEKYVEPTSGPVQKFSVVRAAETPYTAHPLRPWLLRRDLGIAHATGGRVNAHLSRCAEPMPGPTGLHRHDLDFQMVFILQGICEFDYGEHGVHTLLPGDCVYQPPGVPHDVLSRSDDCEILEITSPADFPTEALG